MILYLCSIGLWCHKSDLEYFHKSMAPLSKNRDLSPFQYAIIIAGTWDVDGGTIIVTSCFLIKEATFLYLICSQLRQVGRETQLPHPLSGTNLPNTKYTTIFRHFIVIVADYNIQTFSDGSSRMRLCSYSRILSIRRFGFR